MSYDFEIHNKQGRVVFDTNYTSNISTMIYHALLPEEVQELKDGTSLLRADELLCKLLQKMLEAPKKYRRMNPENGWGDYESFLETVLKCIFACQTAPRGSIFHMFP